jgi:CDP-glucose 4,6-dehydratase
MINFSKLFWKNKKILITGHTGFKGSWLSLVMKFLGAKVYGISLRPEYSINLYDSIKKNTFEKSYLFDLRNLKKTKYIINKIKPEIVFHLAAQSIVSEGYKDPINTYSNNIMSTLNIFESLRNKRFCKILLISTTDKVYEVGQNKSSYKETDRLGGHDPYSTSKSCVELIINSYKKSFFNNKKIKIICVRAGNIVGGGDWSKNRIIPDAIKSWKNKKKLKLRSPIATRPWQHVLDALFSYLLLCQVKFRNSDDGIFNIGPYKQKSITTEKLIKNIGKNFLYNRYSKVKKKQFIETSKLSLNTNKFIKFTGFKPRWNIKDTLKYTALWYSKFLKNKEAEKNCYFDIKKYFNGI